jgi:hypothetical protein
LNRVALSGLRVEMARVGEAVLRAKGHYLALEIAASGAAFVSVLGGAFEVDPLAEVFGQNT